MSNLLISSDKSCYMVVSGNISVNIFIVLAVANFAIANSDFSTSISSDIHKTTLCPFIWVTPTPTLLFYLINVFIEKNHKNEKFCILMVSFNVEFLHLYTLVQQCVFCDDQCMSTVIRLDYKK